jgi:hypothetical protein
MVAGFAKNNYTRPEGQNVGNFLSDRNSSRVLAPPGGGSSIVFGDAEPAATEVARLTEELAAARRDAEAAQSELTEAKRRFVAIAKKKQAEFEARLKALSAAAAGGGGAEAGAGDAEGLQKQVATLKGQLADAAADKVGAGATAYCGRHGCAHGAAGKRLMFPLGPALAAQRGAPDRSHCSRECSPSRAQNSRIAPLARTALSAQHRPHSPRATPRRWRPP